MNHRLTGLRPGDTGNERRILRRQNRLYSLSCHEMVKKRLMMNGNIKRAPALRFDEGGVT
jgi:hypothetical protein